MKLKNNKGITGIDVSIALIIIVLFISLLSTLVFNYVVTSRGVNRKATATNIAVNKIESLKLTAYDDDTMKEGITTNYADSEGQIINAGGATGPYKITTEIASYKNSIYTTDMEEEERNKLEDVMKIVSVKVEYTVSNKDEKIEIRTAITKGD